MIAKENGFLRLAALLVSSWLSPRAAFAQANYDGALIGGRSSLMGGTGVAVGTDAAALTQNPATTIDIEGTSFVFSTFATQFSRRSIDPGEGLAADVRMGEAELSQTDFNVLPNATCLFLDLKRTAKRRRGAHKLSFCVTEPERSEFDLTTRALAVTNAGSGAFQTRFVGQLYSKKVYSAGWAVGLSERLSVGITPMLEVVAFDDREAVTTILSDATSVDDLVGASAQNVTSIMTKRASSVGLSALIGAQYHFSKLWAAGLSLQFPSLSFTGEYDASRSAESALLDAAEYTQDRGEARFRYPFRVAAGLAGAVPGMTFELDAYFHTGKSNFAEINSTRETLGIGSGVVTALTSESTTELERVRPTVNVGFGVDVPLGKNWSLVSGLLTDFSGLEPRRSQTLADASLFRSRVNSVHGSVGVAWTPRVGSILLGVRGMYGAGELALSDPRSLPTERVAVDQTLWSLALVISGQVTLEMLAMVDPTGLVQEPVEKQKPKNSK